MPTLVPARRRPSSTSERRPAAATSITREPAARSARRAGLRYVNDRSPGLTRIRKSDGFSYLNARGKPIRDAATLARIGALVIPPAWTDVWISPWPNGHLQATGRDARGRKQSRYHADFRASRDASKYERVIAFAKALPKIRRTVRGHLRQRSLTRERVLATVVSLLEKTLIRVGNEQYARDNKHFGLTTIHNRHVKVTGSRVRFHYVGKSGVKHDVELDSPELARVVRACQELPEQELFEYVDDAGKRRDVKSDDVNAYLKQITGQDFTAKDFRTWAGTVLASQALAAFEVFDSQTQAKRNVVAAIESVAKKLGNTTAVCRKCYVHPAILHSYLDGSLAQTIRRRAEVELRHSDRLTDEERSVVALLRDRVKGKR